MAPGKENGARAGLPSASTSAARPLSVVVPTWNGGARFRELLVALASQDVEHELLVVDSGSRDGTAEAARAAGARVLSIPQSEFNHGATRNRAIAATHGEIVALLTQDALPMGRDYLASLARPFANPRVDGVYARQYPRPDCDPLLAERLRRWSAARSEPSLQVFAPGDPEAARKLYQSLPPMERYLSCVFDNVASAVRRTSWEQHPFPARTFGEDVAWGRAILLAGGALAYEPSARVEHSHRIDMLREFKRLYCDHRNLYELFELFTVRNWRAVWHGARGQQRVYRELLEAQALTPAEQRRWRLYSIPYTYVEGAAQFLGARSHWKTKESRFWAWADRRIRRGV
ncbi:MAG: glycosyltransferase family 2 protein [Planctomycetes bacterium]|nr:glycosyltransferase family 2 protein [Planctomycetota bacterium]